MCRDDITVFVICRMLYRSKFLNFLTYRKNNDTARVLSCRSSDTGASLNDPVNLTVTLMLSTFFIIIFHITECCFFCKCADGSCLECLTLTENNLRITMGICLIFTGEIQVNIRLFISLKSKERFKRNVKSLFIHLCSTFRADTIRHIASRHTTEFFYFR